MLKWTVSQIRRAAQPFLFDAEIVLDTLVEMRYDIQELSPILVEGKIAILGEDRFAIFLDIKGEAKLLSANTFEAVAYPFEMEIKASASSLYNDQDEDVIVIDNQQIDLLPYIQMLVDIQLPTHILSETNNLPQGGTHWKVSDETPKKDSPFAQLRNLIEEKDKK